MRACLSEAEIEQAAEGTRSAAGSDTHRHLVACDGCRTRVEELRGDRALFAELGAIARESRREPAIPGYRIERELVRGGQGIVYRALQEETGRPVALKVLAENGRTGARERRRFEREVELASRLAHPGIVTLHDSGIASGRPWLAMELVEGTTLGEHVARARPGTAEKLRLFLELCAAVTHAHRRGVIHRDLKPANVLVDAQGRVRVLDFGTALAIGEHRDRLTAPGEFLGTLAYASPEQVRGRAGEIDTRTDVYSLGVVLYELATGHLPYDVASGLSEAVESIAHAPPVDPARSVPGLDRDLCAVLLRALEKDPERRYPSVDALARDVRHVLAGEPIEARRKELLHVARKALARHKRLTLSAVVVLAVGAALLVALAREHLHAERSRQNSELVRALIRDLLSASAPQRMGSDARLLEVLQLASPDIDAALERAPDAQAALELTLGDTYRRLLMHGEAETHLRKALARFRTAEGADRLDVAHCLDRLGRVLSEQNRPEAIAVQEEALALRRAALPAGDPRIAESERELAQALLAQFRDVDLARARDLLESALAGQRSALGDDHPDTAETKLALARLKAADDPAAVEALLGEALATFERHAPTDSRFFSCMVEMSAFLQEHRRFDEAAALLESAARLTEQLYGGELAPELMRRQARLYFARGDAASAEDLTRRALVVELSGWRARRPEDSERIGALVAALESARPPAEEPPYAEAFALLRRYRGDGTFELAQWSNGIALALRAQGRDAATEPLLREALAIRCRAFGADCPVRQRTLYLLADVLAGESRNAEACTLLEQSLAIAERNPDSERETARSARALRDSCCAPAAPPASASEDR